MYSLCELHSYVYRDPILRIDMIQVYAPRDFHRLDCWTEWKRIGEFYWVMRQIPHITITIIVIQHSLWSRRDWTRREIKCGLFAYKKEPASVEIIPT